jgi:hypothetical protein
MLVLVVTKNVRAYVALHAERTFRKGFAIAGAKAPLYFEHFRPD